MIFRKNLNSIQIGWHPQKALVIENIDETKVEQFISNLESWKYKIAVEDDFYKQIIEDLKIKNFVEEITTKSQEKLKIRIHGKGQISDYFQKNLKLRNYQVEKSSQRIRKYEKENWDNDLIILTDNYIHDPSIISLLMKRSIPHFAIHIRDGIGNISPLIIPGKTACLNCINYFRAANFKEWPIIANQLFYKPTPNNPIMTHIISGFAFNELEKILFSFKNNKGFKKISILDHSLEVNTENNKINRQYWPKNPLCPC